jgi:hypothetical protein
MANNGPAKKTPTKKTVTAAPPKAIRYCSALPPRIPEVSAQVSGNPMRARALIQATNKWVNHTVLFYAFFRDGPYAVPEDQAAAVRRAFQTWEALPIGLRFVEVDKLAEAEIRIGYGKDGSWSGIAREILDYALTERTMTFGWDLNDKYGFGTAIHEIGHTIGLPHEHQSPYSGIVWDDDKVYAYFSAPPNSRDHDTIFQNVLRKLDASLFSGSRWDPESIMEYEFDRGLIKLPANYSNGLTTPETISTTDATWVKRWYPANDAGQVGQALPLNQSVTVALSIGEQTDFTLKVEASRDYTIRSFGATDTVLVLFEDVDGVTRFVAGDDDSGTDRTATIKQRLFPGRTYHVRLRLVYPGQQGTVTIMCW